MKVIYRKDILEKILDAKEKAHIEMREIEYVEVSKSEWEELVDKIEKISSIRFYMKASKALEFYGIRVIRGEE